MARRRSASWRCSRAPAVAMNMVSSPDMVPMTSGHRAVSIATATLCAEPTAVFNTVKFVPAVKRALTNCLRVEKSFLAGIAVSGNTYRSPIFGHAQLAQITAHTRLGGNMTVLAQHRDQLG